MRHLTLEEICRLADEAAEPAEALHLGSCHRCRAELAALVEQTEQLGQLPEPEPSPRAWAALEARLRAEGLVRPVRRRTLESLAGLRIAAALAMLVIGGSGGFALWQGANGEEDAPVVVVDRGQAVAPERLPAAVDGTSPQLGTGTEAPPATMVDDPGVTRAPSASAGGRIPRMSPTVREFRETRSEYLSGLARYAEVAEASKDDPVARLIALDALVEVALEALQRAPDDPVINGYYLAAVGQRDSMIRQVALNSDGSWY